VRLRSRSPLVLRWPRAGGGLVRSTRSDTAARPRVVRLTPREATACDSKARLANLTKGECGEEEYKAYRRTIGTVMGSNFDIMNAIYHEHPDLKPEGLDGPYKTDHLHFELADEFRKLAGEE
jgi:hypothetical protein